MPFNKSQNAAILTNNSGGGEQISGAHNPPPPPCELPPNFLQSLLAPSLSRKSSNCFWITRIDQSVFDVKTVGGYVVVNSEVGSSNSFRDIKKIISW